MRSIWVFDHSHTEKILVNLHPIERLLSTVEVQTQIFRHENRERRSRKLNRPANKNQGRIASYSALCPVYYLSELRLLSCSLSEVKSTALTTPDYSPSPSPHPDTPVRPSP